MKETPTSQLSRGEFLKWAGMLGLGLVDTYLVPTAIRTFTSRRREEQIQEYGSISDTSVHATDVALPDNLSDSLSEIPSNLRRSAIRIVFLFMTKDGSGRSSGSGTLIDYDTENKTVIMLSAKHVLDFIRNPNCIGVLISQPHTNSTSTIELSPADFSIACDPKKDLAVMAFKYDQLPFGLLGSDKVLTNYIPEKDESVYSLSFPSSAQKHGFLPSKANLESCNFFDSCKNRYLSENNIMGSFGSSGGLVVTKDGFAFGIIIKIQNGNQTLIEPIGEEYNHLVESAKKNLLSS